VTRTTPTSPRSSAGHGPRTASVRALQRASGALSTAAVTRMDSERPWFRELSAQERSWVGMIVQAGIRGFVEWYAAGARTDIALTGASTDLAASMFGAAPRALTGAITLQQTVDLVRLTIEVVEANIGDLLEEPDASSVREAVGRYAREVAFATAEVYARAAEQRGAWDARLEALVVDAVLRAETDEAVLSRASALGWDAQSDLTVVLGRTPPACTTSTDGGEAEIYRVFEDVRRRARAQGLEALCAVQGERLVALLGGVEDVRLAAEAVVEAFGDGPVVAGPLTSGLADAHHSARSALAAYRAAPGWPEAPRPVLSEDLLPERVLAGDGHARRYLVEDVFRPLAEGPGTLVDTLAAYFSAGGSLEGAGRALFVHPNTVRYRLRQVEEITGYLASRPRDALALQLALVLGRQTH